MSTEFVVIYQKEVEDGLAVVKQEKIPAGDWKSAEDQLKKSLASLQMMEATVRGLPRGDNTYAASAKALRRELNDLMNEVQKNLLLGSTKRGGDVERGLGEDEEDEEEEKKQILKGSGAALHQAKQTLVGIQTNATSIIGELDKQKETIANAKNKVNQTNDATVESRNLLRMIENTSTRQKMITYGALVVVMIAVAVCFYWIVFL